MRWKVTVVRDVTQNGVVFVDAESAEDAVNLAISKFSGSDISEFETDHDTWDASVTAVQAVEGDE